MKKHRALWVIIIVIVVLAAAAAGVGIGLYGSLAEATSHVRLSSTISPNPDVQAVYDVTRKRYAMLYPSLKEAFHTRA